jgi:hypothetical protein
MSITPEGRYWHTRYELSDPLIKSSVDEAFHQVYTYLKGSGFKVSNSDPAESLVGSITKYLSDSVEE